MKRVSFLLATLLVFSVALFAQPLDFGNVAGTVTLSDGTPVPDAMVFLAGVRGGHGGGHNDHPIMLRMPTLEDGSFAFNNVPIGPYTISAQKPRVGFAAELIEVLADQTTNVNLVMRDEHDGPRDSLTIVELSGIAMVLAPDSAHPRMVRYFLDVNGDQLPDFELSFGPPWYNPPSGAVRPEDGTPITIVGGLLTHTDRPVVVVFQLNGEFWRDPRNGGHGGHGGGDHWRRGCDVDSLTLVDLAGTTVVRTGVGFHGEWTRFFLNTDEDTLPEYILDFGGPDYVPPSGAVLPVDGEEITIVGGELYCPNHPEDAPAIVIVYEINGLLWRTPGDTVGLGPMILDAADAPVAIGAPATHIAAHNYPNPFNPATTINYSIPMAGDVKVAIYDITGREVANLVNTYQNSGSYAVHFDGT
ncbi:MAG: carboxypeptidase regulatory-like domain-containing protein, partial [Calditrichota bacterium]